jgi:hypothetical protein
VIFGMGTIIGGQLTGLAENFANLSVQHYREDRSGSGMLPPRGACAACSTMLNVLRNEVSKTPTTADGGSAASTP